MTSPQPPHDTPEPSPRVPAVRSDTTATIMRRVLVWSAWLTLAIAVIGGIVGFFIADWSGVWSALVAAGLTLIFTGLTVVSVILAARFDTFMFLAVIMGMWIVKFIAFIAILALVKQLGFTHDWMLWSTMVAAIVGQLAIDVIVVQRSRQPVV